MKIVARNARSTVDPVGLTVSLLHLRWRKYRRALKDCRRQCSEVSVHRLRVASRRLLASLAVACALVRDGSAAEAAQRALKKQLSGLGPLRDTQVQVLLLNQYRKRFPEVEEIRQIAIRREQELILAAAKMFKRRRTGELRKLVEAQSEMLREQLKTASARRRGHAALARALREAFARVEDRLEQIDESHPATVHRTRVALKKFRYVAEAMRPLLREFRARDFVQLRFWQSKMGRIQDFGVLLDLLRSPDGRPNDRRRVSYERIKEALSERRTRMIRSLIPTLTALRLLRARLPR